MLKVRIRELPIVLKLVFQLCQRLDDALAFLAGLALMHVPSSAVYIIDGASDNRWPPFLCGY